MYMPKRSWMILIMGQIKPEHPEFFALEFGKMLNLTVNILASTNINQSAPNLVQMYLTIRSGLSLIMDLIGPELSELFALGFLKIAESDFVYSLASTDVDQIVPNMVRVHMIMRSWMRLIMGQIGL